MKIIFTLGSPAIGGGTNVIFEHASRLSQMGNDVYIVSDKRVHYVQYQWHSGGNDIKFVSYQSIENELFDVAIITWWITAYDAYKINAKKYLYFVQSIESKFYDDIWLKKYSELTYLFDMPVITEATWIKDYLESKYNLKVKLVLNGIRKDIYKVKNVNDHEGLRVLIEGPIDVGFKNVPRTIELVKKSKADEIWLLTSSNIKKYPDVDKVFSRVNPIECPEIYSSCDVIVKLSYVEGMFGPPLEMFHCGGTCVVYNVTGSEEYIVDDHNGFVVETNDETSVIERINSLKDEKILARLKKNALKTAEKWPDWSESSENFYDAIKELIKLDGPTQESLKEKSVFFRSIYEEGTNNKNITSLRRKIGDILRKRFPFFYYKIYRRIVK